MSTAIKYDYPRMVAMRMSNPQETKCSRFRTSKIERFWDKYHQYIEIIFAVIIGIIIGGCFG